MTRPRKKTYQTGLWAEYLAALYLFLKGYKLVGHRHKSPFGEIDLLAVRGNTLICVEVKFRRNGQNSALESVSLRNRSRIIQAVKFFQSRHPSYAYPDIRFDILTLSLPFSIRHHQNAWYDSSL